MFIQQLYTSCLSEAAYYIESEGEAAIIDPIRDTTQYLELARSRNATIRYIFETHFHADFISGHLDLAAATGAPIVFGPATHTRYNIHKAKDGEQFTLGKLSFEVIHTPGHTIESSCFLLKDENDQPHAIFTGDTLFVGDVGRPDLSSGDLSKEELAALLFDSLQKLAALPDQVLVYPAHGAGSNCGKNLGPETYSTLGEQKAGNYALQESDKQKFIDIVTEGLPEIPVYFPINARINKEGYGSLEEIIHQGLRPLTVEKLQKKLADESIVLVDTRPVSEFAQAFIPGAISIGLEGRFAEWAGSLVPFKEEIVFVCAEGREEESLIRLARVGFEKFGGFLKGGFAAWQNAGAPIDLVIEVEADELAMDLPHDPHLLVVDVRKPTEFGESHVLGAQNLPLADMNDPATMANFEDHQNIYLHCASGYRSIIAVSLLKRQGIHNVRNIIGGFAAIREQSDIPQEKEPSLLN